MELQGSFSLGQDEGSYRSRSVAPPTALAPPPSVPRNVLGEAAERREGHAEPRPPGRGAQVWAEGHGTQEGQGSQVPLRAQVLSFEKRSAPPNCLPFLSNFPEGTHFVCGGLRPPGEGG